MGNEVSDDFLSSLESESSIDIDSFLRDDNHMDSLLDACLNYFDNESITEELLDNQPTPTRYSRIDTPYTPQTPYSPETPLWPQTPLTPFRPQTPYTSDTPYTPTPDISSRPKTPVSSFRPIDLPQRNLNSQTPFCSVDYDTRQCTWQEADDEKMGLETIHHKRRVDDNAENANNIMNQLSYLNEIRDCRERGGDLNHQMSVDQKTENGYNPYGLTDRKRRASGSGCETLLKKVKSSTNFQTELMVQKSPPDHITNNTNLDINGNPFDQTPTTGVVNINNSVYAQIPTEGCPTNELLGLSSKVPENDFPFSFHYLPKQTFSMPLSNTPWLPLEENLTPGAQINFFQPPSLRGSNMNGVYPFVGVLEGPDPILPKESSASSPCPCTSSEEPLSDLPGTPSVEAESVKTKLKHVISSRLKMKGVSEIKIDFIPKPEPEMTEDEKMKVRHRKKLNNESAARYRKNKEERQKELEEEADNLDQRNAMLQKEMNERSNQIRDMTTLLRHIGYTDDHINAALAQARNQPGSQTHTTK